MNANKELEEVSIVGKGKTAEVVAASETAVSDQRVDTEGIEKAEPAPAAPKSPLIAELPHIATRSLQALNQILTSSFAKKPLNEEGGSTVENTADEAADKKEQDASSPTATAVDRFGALKAATSAGLGIAANTFQTTVQKAVIAVTPEVDEKYVAFGAEEGTIEGVINARDASRIPFFVPKNRAISWKIMVKAYDVAVSVKLRVQEMGGAVEQELEQRTILNAGSILFGGRKASDIERHIVLEIDNSYSKLRTKTAAIKVLIGEAAVAALREEELRIEAAEEKRKEAAEAARLLIEKEKEKEAEETAAQNASKVSTTDTAGQPAASSLTFGAVRGGLANVWGSIVVGAQTAAAKAVTASEGTTLHGRVSSLLGVKKTETGTEPAAVTATEVDHSSSLPESSSPSEEASSSSDSSADVLAPHPPASAATSATASPWPLSSPLEQNVMPSDTALSPAPHAASEDLDLPSKTDAMHL